MLPQVAGYVAAWLRQADRAGRYPAFRAVGEAGQRAQGRGAVFLTSDAGATKERLRSEEGRQRLPSGPERASQHSQEICR